MSKVIDFEVTMSNFSVRSIIKKNNPLHDSYQTCYSGIVLLRPEH